MHISEETAAAPVVNIAAYKFAPLDNLDQKQKHLETLCGAQALKGTILLSQEGINLFIAGSRPATEELLSALRKEPKLADLTVKESLSAEQPFTRMLVKQKNEIIAFGVDGIDPEHEPAPRLEATQLKQWLDQGRKPLLLDVRNDYEIALGTFDGAQSLNLDHFREFPERIPELLETYREQPIVTFCTGGIRCEKAAPLMQQLGFAHVYQLDGGILQYFEDCGGAHYHGECFVFDKRVTVDPRLRETGTTQCYVCQHPVTPSEQQDSRYREGLSCPACYESPRERLARRCRQRQAAIRQATEPLPGSIPYLNRRPLRVKGRFVGLTLLDFVSTHHPHIERAQWLETIAAGHICYRGEPVAADRLVEAGEQYLHLIPNTVEPAVDVDIDVLYEDEALFVIDKPAPLPVHPCGRFNRNTLTTILRAAVRDCKLRPVHRLDAGVTGVQILAKTREDASRVQRQFAEHTVEKAYLAEVIGQPSGSMLRSDRSIARTPKSAGRRDSTPQGASASTRIEVLRVTKRGALLRVQPISGRTNQIRIHLTGIGHAIVGDSAYGAPETPGEALVQPQPLHLHSREMTLCHPRTGERVTFRAPLPNWYPKR